MIKTLFSINMFATKCKNWKTKKKQINKHIKKLKFEKRKYVSHETTRYTEQFNFINVFCDIFSDEIQKFFQETGFKSIDIKDIWTVKYNKYDSQNVHHHGRAMYSGILYVDLDKKHPPTSFIAPWSDEISGELKFIELESNEGDFIVFPSHLKHFVKTNFCNKERITISFDFNVYS